jgi:hypothetical protein
MFELKENRRNIPDEELLADVKRVAEMLETKILTRPQYEKHGKFGFTTVIRRLGKWSKVLEKAELEVKVPIYNSNEELFANLAEIWTKLGKQPTYNNLSKVGSRFSSGTYENRFGSWNDALKAFIDFINNGDIEIPKLESKFSATKTPKRTARNINWRLRAKILIKDNCICQMCGTSPAKNPDITLHVDHKNGDPSNDHPDNLRLLCPNCHSQTEFLGGANKGRGRGSIGIAKY